MPQNQLLTGMMKRSMDMLEKHVGDFTDAEMLVRPVPNANHAAWQLSHLVNSSLGMAKMFDPNAQLQTPPNFENAHTKEAAASDDPKRFPPKAELLKMLRTIVEMQSAAIEKMTDEQLAQPSPEKARSWAPTFAALAMMGPLHNTMHVGQFQVIRRKLGRPVMF